ncbi:MAG: hypothetical protein L0H36_03345 [bacterium]|nr:hypothetical protein [bacterium]MDN5835647.1 hypothetical protein [bacterium]
MKKIAIATMVAAALVLTGCGDSNSTASDEKPSEVVVTPSASESASDETECSPELSEEECQHLDDLVNGDEPVESEDSVDDFVAPDIDSDDEMFADDPNATVDNSVVYHSDGGEYVEFGTTVVYRDHIETRVDLEKFKADKGEEFCGANEGKSYIAILKTTLTNGKPDGSLIPYQDDRSIPVVEYVDSYGDTKEGKPSTTNWYRDNEEFWEILGYDKDPNPHTDGVKKVRAGESWSTYSAYCMSDMRDLSETGFFARYFTGDGVISGWDKGNTYWSVG